MNDFPETQKARCSMRLPRRIFRQIEMMRTDNRSGSAELALDALKVLRFFARSTQAVIVQEFRLQLRVVAQRLFQAQPDMAAVLNLTNRVLWAAEKQGSITELRKSVIAVCRELEANLRTSNRRIGEAAYRLIKSGSTILTYSRSSTVEAALIAARKRGKKIDVICSESRPLLEGVTLAKSLGKNGIRVTLMADAAAFANIGKADLVMVGADAVTSNGVVNKIGTHTLARLAHAQKIPFYVLCGSEKFVPARHVLHIHRLRNPRELLAHKTRNIVVLNEYFDETALNSVTGIVTEEGLHSPTELCRRLRKSMPHNMFQTT